MKAAKAADKPKPAAKPKPGPKRRYRPALNPATRKALRIAKGAAQVEVSTKREAGEAIRRIVGHMGEIEREAKAAGALGEGNWDAEKERIQTLLDGLGKFEDASAVPLMFNAGIGNLIARLRGMLIVVHRAIVDSEECNAIARGYR